jgi:hypothetical protein
LSAESDDGAGAGIAAVVGVSFGLAQPLTSDASPAAVMKTARAAERLADEANMNYFLLG